MKIETLARDIVKSLDDGGFALSARKRIEHTRGVSLDADGSTFRFAKWRGLQFRAETRPLRVIHSHKAQNMLQVVSPLKGFAIEASDDRIGTVADFLFDDVFWKVRWLVIDCGTWLTGRKVLIHPSAISARGSRVAAIRCRADDGPGRRQPRIVRT